MTPTTEFHERLRDTCYALLRAADFRVAIMTCKDLNQSEAFIMLPRHFEAYSEFKKTGPTVSEEFEYLTQWPSFRFNCAPMRVEL